MNRTSAWVLGLLAATAIGCTKADSGNSDGKIKALQARVDKLEAAQKKYDEVAAFVGPIMEQQKQQQEEEEAHEPDPDARFAVDISGDPVDGAAGAAVTVVEAWDFG